MNIIALPTPDPEPRRFVPPSVEQCIEAGKANGMPDTEGQKFWFFYDSKNWLVGRTKMKQWRSAMAGWALRWRERQEKLAPSTSNTVALSKELDRILAKLSKGKDYFDAPTKDERTQLKARAAQIKMTLGLKY